jgi:transposase
MSFRLHRTQRRRGRSWLRLEVVKHPMAKRGFVLLPKRWVVERSFALGGTLSKTYQRLRKTPDKPQGISLHRLRMHHAHSHLPTNSLKT